MLGPRPLSANQQRAVERVARELGVACRRCGSMNLRSADRAVLTHHYVTVMLMCANPDADHPENIAAVDQSYPFEYADAARFGIEEPPTDPPPRRNPGDTFPRA